MDYATVMIAAYHLIWTAYGWWLPNDPRGSSSLEIRTLELRDLGQLHQGRRKIQPARWVIRDFYQEADDLLRHQRMEFTASEIAALGLAFAEAVANHRYTCYACAIMPDHVHALIRKHKHEAEEMIANLQSASRDFLIAAGHRQLLHPVWGGPGWKVFLETEAEIRKVIRYIEQNPIKIGLPAQVWPFVKPYDGWIPGKRLR